MELLDLGLEYLNRCEILLDRIHALSSIIEHLSDNESALLKRRIATLADEISLCRECANILINYHRKE